MKSILQEKKECYVTGRTYGLHKHHVFEGTANRKKSEKWGFYIWLIPEFHNIGPKSIHNDYNFDLRVKKEAQKKFIERHGYDKWMAEFHKDYSEIPFKENALWQSCTESK